LEASLVSRLGLDDALDRLLHQRSVREAFLAGRFDALALARDDLEALATVDRAQLSSAADKVRTDLLHRRHRGSGGLPSLYPRTLAAWTAAHPEDADFVELLSRFMESEAFGEYREIPFSGPGCSLEEAFHRFCEGQDIGEPAARNEEFFTAMMKALLLSPRADFTLPVEVQVSAGGFFAVSRRSDPPMLYAAVAGRLLAGALTPFLAELLTCGHSPSSVAERYGVSQASCDASLTQLTALGLLPLFEKGEIAAKSRA
jgi:hypothetical protein